MAVNTEEKQSISAVFLKDREELTSSTEGITQYLGAGLMEQ